MRKDKCKRGHSMADAHVTTQPRGIKRTCRKCRYIRHKSYYGIGEFGPDSGFTEEQLIAGLTVPVCDDP